MPAAVTNEAFLEACFGAAWQDAHVTGFTEAPEALEGLGLRHSWAGYRWRCGQTKPAPAGNNYFTISLFCDDPADGRARRRKELFRATHVIVVDDVGTKVDPAAVANLPPPSWKLETSPGNWQWGYILGTPETDAGRVNALLDGMVAAGLCPDGKDPGMKGVTRYVRLPVGRNTKAKYGPGGFTCRLTEWHPERRFTMDELAAPWGIALPLPGATAVAGSRPTAKSNDGDTLFGHLDGWGMISGQRTGDGGFMCSCPWTDEHTGGADTGAAYWPGGGFKCHHGHCEHKNRRDLIAWIDARLRAEGKPGLASEDFRDADRRELDRFWNTLAAGHAPTSQDIARLARVPGHRDVDAMFQAARAVLGTNAKPIRRRVARARKRHTREAHPISRPRNRLPTAQPAGRS